MKKGFTLIELLAVIIILAIIALIATPIVLDVVDDARKSVAETEAKAIVDGVNKRCQIEDLKDINDNTKNSICLDEEKTGYEVTTAEVADMVDLGNATVSSITYTKDGGVTALVITSNGYTVTYSNGSYSVSSGVAE